MKRKKKTIKDKSLTSTGFVESVVPTGFMTIVSGYYTQKEQSLRQAWWFSGTGWFTIIGGAMNYGFGQITSGSLKRWQYIYIFAGVLTFLFGIWCCVMPNSPVSASSSHRKSASLPSSAFAGARRACAARRSSCRRSKRLRLISSCTSSPS